MADLTSYTGPCEAVADMAAEQGPDILNDGKNVVSPFMAGERGDAVLKTVFEPTQDNRRWLEGYLGRPLSPMSGLRNNVPASAQPLGFSADVKPSMKESMPEMPASGKSRLPVIAGAGSGAELALWPAGSPDDAEGAPAARTQKKTCSGSRVNALPHHSRHLEKRPSRSRAKFLLSENRHRSLMGSSCLIRQKCAREGRCFGRALRAAQRGGRRELDEGAER